MAADVPKERCCCVSADGGRRDVRDDSRLLLLCIYHCRGVVILPLKEGEESVKSLRPSLRGYHISVVQYLHPPLYKY